jgi:hypothetical protein
MGSQSRVLIVQNSIALKADSAQDTAAVSSGVHADLVREDVHEFAADAVTMKDGRSVVTLAREEAIHAPKPVFRVLQAERDPRADAGMAEEITAKAVTHWQ